MPDRKYDKHALVIGATGGIGGALVRTLIARGWTVAALNRNPEAAAKRTRSLPGLFWIEGDAMNPADVLRAAQGARLIVHGANPPGYRNWQGLALPMLESSIAAAKATDARLVFPGTVYNYGPDAGASVDEAAPQNPLTRKGKIRVAMENRLRESGVKTLIVRAGDFFASEGGSSWLSQAIVKPGKMLRSISYPGPHRMGHQWAYLSDLAETFGRLIDREDELDRFDSFHFGGHWLEPGIEMANAIRRVTHQPSLRITSLPWWAIRLVSPFNETFREMLEMRYLWQRPLRLTNAKLIRFLGSEPHTPLDTALQETLKGLGCLPELSPPAPLRGKYPQSGEGGHAPASAA